MNISKSDPATILIGSQANSLASSPMSDGDMSDDAATIVLTPPKTSWLLDDIQQMPNSVDSSERNLGFSLIRFN